MSQNYQQYGGNPYGAAAAGYGQGQAQSSPYGGGYGSNPYGGGVYDEQLNPSAPLQHNDSNYSQPSQYSAPALSNANTQVPHTDVPMQQAYAGGPQEQHGSQPLARDDFLSRVNGVKERINQLTADIASISTVHQRMLSSPDNRSSSELESIITQTQIRNTQIKDEIKFLEKDASRQPVDSAKQSQLRNLKNSFSAQLEEFKKEEQSYSKRYREALGRQYRIINPEATDAEVNEAANADWGDEGIFTQALKSNRSGQASSVLGAVRARHNDIQRIEKTMSELALLFTQLNEQVVYQEAQVDRAEVGTTDVVQQTTDANKKLDSGIKSARNARKLKWWCLFLVVLILLIVGLAVGLYFGVGPGKNK